jgi:MFS family permease
LAYFLIGWGGGMINGICNALISDISGESTKKRSANLSILGIFFGLGALGMPAIIGLFSDYYSIENILTFTGLSIILPVIYFMLIAYPPGTGSGGFALQTIGKMLKNPLLLGLSFLLSFQSGIESMVNNWSTSYLQDYQELTAQNSLYMLSVFVLSFTVGRLILGIVLHKVSSLLVIRLSIFSILAGFMIVWHLSTMPLLILGYTMLGLGLAYGFPVLLGYVGSIFQENTGTAFSIALTIALLGNMLANYIMGIMSEYYSMIWYIIINLVQLFLMSILLIIVLKQLPKLKIT